MKIHNIAAIAALTLSCCFMFMACGSDNGDPVTPDTPEKPDTIVTPDKPTENVKPRYIWIDAAANFPRFANSKDNIAEDLKKAADAGFTDIVVDVRPTMGDVLFKTSVVDAVKKLDYWSDSGYAFYERTATWDYLQAFIDEGHRLGLRVNASINTFVGGNLYAYGLGEQGMVFRDASKRDWVTTLNLKRGLVNEMDLTSIDPGDSEYYGTKFLNPCNDDVQTFLLRLLRDLAANYPSLDGIFLDRCRFDDLKSDFSETTRKKFVSYLSGKGISASSMKWPDDVMAPGTNSASQLNPKYFKDFLAFRAKTIYDFVGKAAATVHGANSKIKFGCYVGAWYSSYYTNGVNWASRSYNTAADYPLWANSDYKNYGYAELVDFLLLGCYASTDAVYGTGEWTMQGFCTQARKLLGSKVKFAGGPDVGNSTGFEKGGQHQAVQQSVDACANASDGYFVFDMCHVREYNYWDDFKTAFSKLK